MKETKRKTIEMFQLDSGVCLFVEWLEALDPKVRYRVNARLARVALGNFGDHKLLSDGLSELRFTFGSGYRVYYAELNDVVVLLLSGGDKKSQKRDIKLAKQFLLQFLGEKNG